VGAALLTLIFKFVPSQEVQGMFYGSALIAVLVLCPGGLLDLGRLIRNRFSPLRQGAKNVAALPVGTPS
jgi:hypothetical protein